MKGRCAYAIIFYVPVVVRTEALPAPFPSSVEPGLLI